MIRSSFRLPILAGVVVPLVIAGASFAQGQFSGPPPAPPGANGAPPSQAPLSQAQYMSQTLHLRPDQQAALQVFINAVAAPPGMERMRAQDEQMAMMTTPQRLDTMLARMDESRGLMVSRIAATKRFYAQLTPAQQRIFDTMGSQNGANRGGPSR